MTTPNDVHSGIASILKDIGRLDGSIPPDKDLHADLGIESVNFISILLAMEDRFGINIDDSAFTKARTLDSLVALVNQSMVN